MILSNLANNLTFKFILNLRMQKFEDSSEEYHSTTKKSEKASTKKNKIIVNIACLLLN